VINPNRVITKGSEKVVRCDRLAQGVGGTERQPIASRGGVGDDDRNASRISCSFDDVAVDSGAVLSKQNGGESTIRMKARTNLIDGDTSNKFNREH
jgi:hypothetical protein